MYRIVKNEKPSSEETNGHGPTLSTYIGCFMKRIVPILLLPKGISRIVIEIQINLKDKEYQMVCNSKGGLDHCRNC